MRELERLTHSREEAASAALAQAAERLGNMAEIENDEVFEATLNAAAREVLALAPDPKWLERKLEDARRMESQRSEEVLRFHGWDTQADVIKKFSQASLKADAEGRPGKP